MPNSLRKGIVGENTFHSVDFIVIPVYILCVLSSPWFQYLPETTARGLITLYQRYKQSLFRLTECVTATVSTQPHFKSNSLFVLAFKIIKWFKQSITMNVN